MVRTQVQLTEKQVGELKAVAAKQKVAVAALIRMSVDKMLADDAEIRRRAIAAAGCCHSGVGDLSERHDDYLEEAYSE